MNFTWVAEDYFYNSQFQYNHAQNALSRHFFNGDESILDVGCGDGKITAEIAKKIPNGFVIGIDSSKSMIEFANYTFGKTCNNLSFRVCRAEALDYSNKFDLVVSFACLHWVKDQITFLKGAKSAIKHDGKIIVTLYPKHPHLWDAIEETIAMPAWQKYFYDYENPHINYDIETYKTLCQQVNLTIESLEETVPVAYFKSEEEMKAFLQSWLPHVDQVPSHLKAKFIANIARQFLKKTNTKNHDIIGIPFKKLDAVLLKNRCSLHNCQPHKNNKTIIFP